VKRRRPIFYILDDQRRPVALTGPDPVQRWARWFEGALGVSTPQERGRDKRKVAFTDLGTCTVSTVFLGVDHRFFDDGPPIVFETMVFANPTLGETFPEQLEFMRRYETWEAAEAGHAEVVAEVRQQFWRGRANGK
jgi:hypothetical protein